MKEETLPTGVKSEYQYNSSLEKNADLLEKNVKMLGSRLNAKLEVIYTLNEENEGLLHGVSIDLINDADEIILPMLVTLTLDEAIARCQLLMGILEILKIKDLFNFKNNFTAINNKLSRHAEDSDIFIAEYISDFIMFFNLALDYMASDRGVQVKGLLK